MPLKVTNLGTAAPSQSTNLNPEQGTVRGNPQADLGVLKTARASMETNLIGTASFLGHTLFCGTYPKTTGC